MPLKSNENVIINKNMDIHLEVNYNKKDYTNNNPVTSMPHEFSDGTSILAGGKQVDLTGRSVLGSSKSLSLKDAVRFKTNIEAVKSVMEGRSAKSVISYDLETLGSGQRDSFTGILPHESELKAFSILEASAEEITWKNGKRQSLGLKNYVFGINKTQSDEIKTLVDIFTTGREELNSSQMSTLSTMAKIGQGLSDEGISDIRIVNGIATFDAPESFNKLDTSLMQNGIKALENLGEKGYVYNAGKNTKGFKQMQDFYNMVGSADILMGHNSIPFDHPLMEIEAKKYGMNFNTKPGQLHVDTFEMIKKLGTDTLPMYDETNVHGGQRKLENMAKVKGFSDKFFESLGVSKADQKMLQHTARFDIGMTPGQFDVLHAGFAKEEGGAPRSLMDVVYDDVNASIKESKEIKGRTSSGGKVRNPMFRTANSLTFKNIHGELVNKDDITLDHVTESFVDVDKKGNIIGKQTYISEAKQSTFKRDNIYEFTGIKEYTLDDFRNFKPIFDPSLAEHSGTNFEAIEQIFNTQGVDRLYIGEFSNLTEYNGQKSYVVRSSVDEIIKDMDENLIMSNLSEEQIQKQRNSNHATSTEARIKSYETTGSNYGYETMSKDYRTYKSVEAGFKRYDLDFSRAGIEKLVQEGTFDKRNADTGNIEKANAYETVWKEAGFTESAVKDVDITGQETVVKGKLNTKKLNDLMDSFEYMKSHKLYYSIIQDVIRDTTKNTIYEEDPEVKTKLLKRSNEDLIEFIESKGAHLQGSKITESSIGKSYSLKVTLDGSDHHINMTSKDNVSRAINNIVKRNYSSTDNKKKNEAEIVRKVKSLATQLEKDGVITKAQRNRITGGSGGKGITTSFDSVDALSQYVEEGFNKKAGLEPGKKLLTDQEMANPSKALDKARKDVSIVKGRDNKEKAQKKVKALEFVLSRTGAKEINELDYKMPFNVRDKDGNLVEVSKFLKDNNYKTHATKVTRRALNLKLNNASTGFNSKVPRDKEITGYGRVNIEAKPYMSGHGAKVKTFFTSQMNLDDLEANNFMNVLFGPNGFMAKQDGNIGTTFFTEFDQGKNLRVAKMILASTSSQKLVRDAINDGSYKDNTHMAVIDLPTVEEVTARNLNTIDDYHIDGGARTIGKNGNFKIIERGKKFYVDGASGYNNRSVATIGSRLKWSEKTSVDNVFEVFRYGASNVDIASMLEKGQAGVIESKLNSSITESLSELKDFGSNTVYFNKKTGKYEHRIIATAADYSSFHGVNSEGFLDLMPIIYAEESEAGPMHKRMEALFSDRNRLDPNFKTSADEYFDTWLKHLTTKVDGSRYGQTYGIAGLKGKKKIKDATGHRTIDLPDASFLIEEFALNQNTDLNYLEMMQNSRVLGATNQNIEHQGTNVDLKDEIAGYRRFMSQFISEKHVSKLYATTMPVASQVFTGDIADATRPVVYQGGLNLYANLALLDDAVIEEALATGIKVGSVVEQRPIDLDKVDTLVDADGFPVVNANNKGTIKGELSYTGMGFIEDKNLGLVDHFTVNTRTIDDNLITQRVKSLKSKLSSPQGDKVNETLWKALYGDIDRKLGSDEDIKFKKLIDKILEDFSNRSTNEQKSHASPMLSLLLDKEQFGSLNVSKLDSVLLKDGDIISTGSIIGVDSKGKTKTYTGRGSQVVGFNNGRALLKRLDVPNTEQKTASVSEKSVISISKYDTMAETRLAQKLWEGSFGDDVHSLANLELEKHTSPNFAFERILDMATRAQENGSEGADLYARKVLMGIYVQDDVSDIAKVYERYKDNPLHTKTYVIPTNNDILNKENVVKGYEDVLNKINDDALRAHNKRLHNETMSDADNFLADFYNDAIINEDVNIHRNTIASTRVEKEYSVGSDKFALDDETIAKKTGKIGYKDLYWFGRHVGHSDEARAQYYDFEDGNNLKITGSVGDTVRNYYLNQMKKSPEYLENLKDIKNMTKANVLMVQDIDYSTATSEMMDKLEVDKGVAGDVHHMTLDEVVLHGASSTPETMRDTIFGAAGDKGIVRIDIGDSNMRVQNPLSRGIGSDGKQISRASKYIYLANTSNTFVPTDAEDLFVASNYQKLQSRFFNNIQMAQTGSKDQLKQMENANKNLMEIYNDAANVFNDKEGIFMGKMLNQRVRHSGMSEYGEIIAEGFDEDLNHFKSAFSKNMTIDLSDVRKGAKSLIDVKYVSEKHFLELTRGNQKNNLGIKDVGYQLIHESDYDSSDRFKKSLTDKGILKDGKITSKIDDSMYEKVGRLFMQEEGVGGVDTRYPSFNANTQVAAKIRFRPDSAAYGDSSIIHEHTALKLNADVDGDTGMTVLWGERGLDSRFKFYSGDHEMRIAHDRLIKGQALDNLDFWTPLAKESKQKMAVYNDKARFTAAEYVEKAKKITDDTGRFNSGFAAKRAYKAKYDKMSIGPISNANFYTNDLAYFAYMDSGPVTKFENFEDVYNFTKFTEQKIISAKKGDGDVQIDKANSYNKALRSFRDSSKPGLGLRNTSNVLSEMGFIDMGDFNSFFNGGASGMNIVNPQTLLTNTDRKFREKMINKYLDSLKGTPKEKDIEQQRMIYRGLGSINEMYAMEEVRELDGDYFFRHDAVNKKNMGDAVRALESGSFNKESFSGKLKAEILDSNVDALTEVSNLSAVRGDIGNITSQAYIDEGGNINHLRSTTYFAGRDSDGKKSLMFQTENLSNNVITSHIASGGDSAFTHTDTRITSDMDKMGFKAVGGEVATLEAPDLRIAYQGMAQLKEFSESGLIGNTEYEGYMDQMHRALIDKANNVKAQGTGSLVDNLNAVVNDAFREGVTNGPLSVKQINTRLGGGGPYDISTTTHKLDLTPVEPLELQDPVSSSDIEALNKKLVHKKLDIKSLRSDIDELVRGTSDTLGVGSKIGTLEQNMTTRNVINKLTSIEIESQKNYSDTIVKAFEGNENLVNKTMGWNKNIRGTISELQSATSYIHAINEYGEARMYGGSFTGSKLADLSLQDINTVMGEFEEVMSLSSGSELNAIKANYDAAVNYREIVGASVTANSELNDPQLETLYNKAIMESSVKVQDIDAQRAVGLSGIDIGEDLRRSHQSLIDKAALERVSFSNNIDDVMMSKGAGKKAILTGVGLAIAGTLMAGSLGVAGNLDPDKRQGLGDAADSGVVFRKKNPGQRVSFGNTNPMMEKRSNYINAKGIDGVNDKAVIEAMKANYGAENVRVNITNESFDDNNSKWLEREMSGYLL